MTPPSERVVDDGTPTGAGEVVPMLPTWPEVRCDGCRKVYTLPEHKRSGIVVGDCPRCHHGRFSTSFSGDVPAVMLDTEASRG